MRKTTTALDKLILLCREL